MQWESAYFWGVACLAKLQGYVDAIGRPIVAVTSMATGDAFLATVDTGFNGSLMTSAFDAPTLGVRLTDKAQRVELGDGRSTLLRAGKVIVSWLGMQREIDVFISEEPSRGGEGRPVALIGAELLAPHLLLVDYGARTVDIETQQ